MSKDGTKIDELRETSCINDAIDLYLGGEYRADLVERALNWRKNASPEAQGLLKAAINASNFSVPGFRSTSAYNAPPGRLLSPTIEHMPMSNGLSAAILRVWIESHESLHAEVVEYRKKADLPIQNYISGRQFPSLWSIDEWHRETDDFTERHGTYHEEDVALMLCCVSGNMPLPPPDDLDDEAVFPEGSIFPKWIEYLKLLPPDAPEWQEAENFIGEFGEVRQAKQREAEQALAAAFAEAIAYIRDNFLDELRYLEVDIDAWWSTDASSLADISRTQQTVEQLGALLLEYCQVRIQASTRSEEDARRAKRSELEPQILSLIEQIDRHLSGDWDPDDDTAPPGGKTLAHPNKELCVTRRSSPEDPRGEGERGEGRGVRGDGEREGARAATASGTKDVLQGFPNSDSSGSDSDAATEVSGAASESQPDAAPVALQADYAELKDKHEKVQAERQEFEQQVEALQLDTQSLRENEDGLRRKLYESKQNYRALRSAFVAMRRSEADLIQSPSSNGADIPRHQGGGRARGSNV